MLTFAAGCFLRSAALVGAALLARRWLRGRPARARHRVFLFAFVLLALEPLAYVLSPQVVLSWVPEAANVVTRQSFRAGRVTTRVSSSPWLESSGPLAVYLLGVCLVSGSLLKNWRKATFLRRRAVPAGEEWGDLAHELCRHSAIKRVPQIVIGPEEMVPFVSGLRRTSIVLPPSSGTWLLNRKRAVLLHELGHLQRRDIAVQLFASFVVMVWWFQPLAWFMLRELRRESEAASDAFVLTAGVRPSEYAAELVAIAQTFRRRSQLPVPAIGMSREHGLATRVSELLSELPAEAVSRPIWLALIGSLMLLTVTVSAVSVDTHDSKGGIFMKRALIAGILVGAGVSAAANVSGTIYDESGAAVTNTKVVISDSDNNSVSQESATDAHGRFSFSNLPQGEYILRAQRPGFSTLLREFRLESDSDVERGLTLHWDSAEKNAGGQVADGSRAAAPEPNNPQQLRVAGSFEQSKLIRKVQPGYPASAKTAGIQGAVKLEAAISKDGVPEDIRVISSPDESLSQSALEAVRQWRYQPTLLNGEPVGVVTEVMVNYTLMK